MELSNQVCLMLENNNLLEEKRQKHMTGPCRNQKSLTGLWIKSKNISNDENSRILEKQRVLCAAAAAGWYAVFGGYGFQI